MAIGLVGFIVGAGAADGANVTLTFGVAPQQNDVVLVWGGHIGASPDKVGPSTAGYTQHAISTANTSRFGLWSKVMGGTPDTNVVCLGTGGVNDAATYQCAVLRGVDTANIMDVAATIATGSGTTPNPATSGAIATNGAWCLACAGNILNDTSVGAVPSGFKQGAQSTATDTNAYSVAGAFDTGLTSGGTEDPGTWAGWGTGTWAAITAIIRPATTSPPKVWWFADSVATSSSHGKLDDSAVPTGADHATGWLVAKTATTTPFDVMQFGTEKSGSWSATTEIGGGPATNNCWRTESKVNGTFASGQWLINCLLEANNTASAQRGRLRMRVWRSANADGSSATQITTNSPDQALVSTTSGALTKLTEVTDLVSPTDTSVDMVTITWSPGSLTLSNEYLFFETEWEITTAGGSNSSNVRFLAGPATTVVAPALTVNQDLTPTLLASDDAFFTPQINLTILPALYDDSTPVRNFLTGSEDFDNGTDWNPTNVTFQLAQGSGRPFDSRKNPLRFIESALNGQQLIGAASSGVPDVTDTYTFSFFAKYNGRHASSHVGLTSGIQSIFNLLTGASSTGAGATSGMEYWGNGWWRCWTTMLKNLSTAAGNEGTRIGMQDDATLALPLVGYQGDGSSGIFCFGAMLARGPLGPYVPTASGSVYSGEVWPFQSALQNHIRQNNRLRDDAILQNYLRFSEDLEQEWAINGDATFTFAGLPGGQQADGRNWKITEGTAADSHGITNSSSQKLGASFMSEGLIGVTFSVVVKSNGRDVFLACGGGGQGPNAFFDLTGNSTGLGTVISIGGSGANRRAAIKDLGGGWYRCSLSGEVNPVGDMNAQVSCSNITSLGYTGNGTSGLYVGAFQFAYDGIKTYTNSGAYLGVNNNVLVDVYENLVQYSEAFSTWSVPSVSPTYDAIEPPLGLWKNDPTARLADHSSNGDLMSPNGTSTTDHYMAMGQPHGNSFPTNTGNDIGPYTASIYVKYAGVRYVELVHQGETSNTSDGVIFDLLTGSVVTTNSRGVSPDLHVTHGMEALPNNWWRIYTTGIHDSFYDFRLYFWNNTTQQAWSGDSVAGVYVWGAQVNHGYLTPYQRAYPRQVRGTGEILDLKVSPPSILADQLFKSPSLLLSFDGPDGSTTITDGSASAHTITVNNAAQIDTDQSKFGGSSLSVPGFASSISVTGTISDFVFGTSDFTIEFFFRYTGSAEAIQLINCAPGDFNPPLYPLLTFSTGGFSNALFPGGGWFGGKVLTPDVWHHIAWVRSKNVSTLYYDGSAEPVHGEDFNNYGVLASEILIGQVTNTGGAWIDHYRIIKGYAAYTNQQLATTIVHFDGTDAATTITDAYGIDYTNTGVELDTAKSKFGTASGLFAAASADWLEIPASIDLAFGTGDFTVDFWFWDAGGASALFGLYDGGCRSSGVALAPQIYVRDGFLRFDETATTGNPGKIDAGTAWPTGQWVHIALTRSGGTTRLFQNGVLQGTPYSDSNNYVITDRPRIGVVNTTPFYADGWVEEFRAIKGRAVWTASFTPPTAPYGAAFEPPAGPYMATGDDIFYEATIAVAGQSVLPDLYVDTDAFFTQTVTPGAVTIDATRAQVFDFDSLPGAAQVWRPGSFGQAEGGWQGFTVRQVIKAADRLTASVGSRIRISFRTWIGNVSGNLDQMWVGLAAADSPSPDPYDIDPLTMTRVTFGGANGITGLADETLYTSDAVVFSDNGSRDLVISFYFSGTSVALRETEATAAGSRTYYSGGSDLSASADILTALPSTFNTIALVETLDLPAIIIDQFLTATLVPTDDAFFTYTVTSEAFLTPALYVETDTFFTYDVIWVISPDLYVDPDTFGTHAVLADQSLAASLVPSDDAFFTYDVSSTYDLAPSLYTDPDAFFTYTVDTTYDLAPSLYVDVDAFGTHTLTASYDLLPSLVVDADVFFTYDVAFSIDPALYVDPDVFFTAQINLEILPSLYVDPDAFFQASLEALIQPDLYVDPDTIFAPSLLYDQTLTSTLYIDDDVFFTHVISAGDSTVTPSLYVDTDTFGTPTITLDLAPSLYVDQDAFFTYDAVWVISPDLYVDGDAFFTPTLTLDVAPALYVDGDAFFTPTLTLDVAPALYDEGDAFFTPTVAAGAVNLAPTLVPSDDAFGAHEIFVETDQDLFASLHTDVDTFFPFRLLYPTDGTLERTFDADPEIRLAHVTAEIRLAHAPPEIRTHNVPPETRSR